MNFELLMTEALRIAAREDSAHLPLESELPPVPSSLDRRFTPAVPGYGKRKFRARLTKTAAAAFSLLLLLNIFCYFSVAAYKEAVDEIIAKLFIDKSNWEQGDEIAVTFTEQPQGDIADTWALLPPPDPSYPGNFNYGGPDREIPLKQNPDGIWEETTEAIPPAQELYEAYFPYSISVPQPFTLITVSLNEDSTAPEEQSKSGGLEWRTGSRDIAHFSYVLKNQDGSDQWWLRDYVDITEEREISVDGHSGYLVIGQRYTEDKLTMVDGIPTYTYVEGWHEIQGTVMYMVWDSPYYSYVLEVFCDLNTQNTAALLEEWQQAIYHIARK